MRTVGLTGGIGCGKSTVAALLRTKGIPALDLDQVARDIVVAGQPALAEIAARWPAVVGPTGLDRKALGAIVVADEGARKALEQITHPRIWAATERWLTEQAAAGATVVVVEAALMVETGSYRRFDQILVVSCDPIHQRARLSVREGYSADTTDRWLAAQMPAAEKERFATAVIHNNGDLAQLQAATEAAWIRLNISARS